MSLALLDSAVMHETVTCQVTGKVVRADETVLFQGMLVSAAGKQAIIDRIRGGESPAGEFERPSVLRRWSCMFIDGTILAVVTAITNVTFTGNLFASGTGLLILPGLMLFVQAALTTVYLTGMHTWQGQTVGKMVGRIKVVTADGAPINPRQAAIRAIAYTGPMFPAALALMSGSNAFSMTINLLASLYWLADIVVALVDRRQRALHDILARTRVIHIEPLPTPAPAVLSCPRCATEMVLGPGQVQFLCACGWSGQVYTFMPYAPPIPPVADAGHDDAGCAYHPSKQAIALCAGSGDYICSICGVELANKTFGVQYLEAAGRFDLLRAFDRHLPRPDNEVLALAAPVLAYPFSILYLMVCPIWLPYAWVRMFRAFKLQKHNALYARVAGSVRVALAMVGLCLATAGALFIAFMAGMIFLVSTLGRH